TVHGRGAVPDDDPLSLGDGWSRLDFFDAFLAQADVCLAVGANFETVTDSSRGAKLSDTLIHVDIDPPAIGRHRPATIAIIGYALPAAIGAQLGRPDRVAVALSGDGGFLYTSQELATAVQQQVNVIAIVFNDHAYGALKLYQDRVHGGRRIGVDLKSPDFSKL